MNPFATNQAPKRTARCIRDTARRRAPVSAARCQTPQGGLAPCGTKHHRWGRPGPSLASLGRAALSVWGMLRGVRRAGTWDLRSLDLRSLDLRSLDLRSLDLRSLDLRFDPLFGLWGLTYGALARKYAIQYNAFNTVDSRLRHG
jgi:hypothetical protein